jgi:iron complex outermembrane receptor protein/hemoglobin/transferrin/lactoferrin receptor protein
MGASVAVALAAAVAASQGATPVGQAPPSYRTVVEGGEDGHPGATEERAASEVNRSDLARRMTRSAPDALRYEPGVFVQQTGHGQGSAYIRGLTGQQTLLLFDGIRLNNSTYRQGPNQYFFTLDARSIDSIEVVRGGASTRWGSDAIGGVIHARPIEAPWSDGRFGARPSLFLRATTADSERGGRLATGLTAPADLSFVGGFGARTIGLLEGGGVVRNPSDGEPALVPALDDDDRTQLGTGFDELTGDARLTWRPPDHELTAAAYLYRQYDAPRTDQCPPPYARDDECLTYEEQFRTLAYAAWKHDGWRATLSWQRQHERRRNDRPASFTVSRGVDDVDTFGATIARSWDGSIPDLHGSAGADTYHDRISSRASIGFTDIDVEQEQSRGQYLDGSTYTYGGAWASFDWEILSCLSVGGGARVAWIAAQAPADPASGTGAIDRSWFPIVGNLRVDWNVHPSLSLIAAFDESFRAPNLDDLTSRQQTGPGFQFENAELDPERATTVEVGARLRDRLISADLWLFTTLLSGAIGRSPREADDCPPDTPQCNASWSRFQLVNADERAWIAGAEAAVLLRPRRRVSLRATAAWTWGEGPNLAERPGDPSIPYEERVPLSRIPPFNGTVEAHASHRLGFGGGVALRWALLQDRLAVADRSDARIPFGGTPGWAVVDLRAWYVIDRRLTAGLTVENVFDAAYRTHGSSINGPGRGLVVTLEVTPF